MKRRRKIIEEPKVEIRKVLKFDKNFKRNNYEK